MGSDEGEMIGGDYCKDGLDPKLLPAEDAALTEHERKMLWRLFVEIGRCWDNVIHDSANLHSTWHELIDAKTNREPTYIAEYSNAVCCVEELIEMYGESNAFSLLFLRNGIPAGPPATRLAHAKHYVVDEFIRAQVLASGFKSWKGKNYKGYIAGSRYRRLPTVRAYEPNGEEAKS